MRDGKYTIKIKFYSKFLIIPVSFTSSLLQGQEDIQDMIINKNIFFKPVEVSCLSHGKTGHVFLTKSAKCYRLSDMLKVGKLNF